MNLYQRMQRVAQVRGAAPALRVPGADALAYAQLDAAVANCSGLLRALGVGRGERVAAQVEKSAASLLLYLACLRSGVIYLPLNTAYTERELGYFLEDATPSLVVCDPSREQRVLGLARHTGDARVLTLGQEGSGSLPEQLAGAAARDDVEEVDDDEPAAILYTSGTTGRPKGALITHRNLASNAEALVRVWQFSDSDVLLHALPIFHAHGLFTAAHCALLSGASMLFLPRFDAAAVISMLAHATVMMGVPTFYSRLLREAEFGHDTCRGVRLFISGSAPLSAETARAFRERTGHAIRERYGTTESMIVTAVPLDDAPPAGTVGKPLPGIELRVAGETGTPLKMGSKGRVQVRGPNVFRGYWQMPRKTAEALDAEGWFTTGDLGAVDAQGWLSLAGRESDMIISGGYNVYPKEIEDLLDAIAGIEESAVIGVPHPDFGEGVLAVVRRTADGPEPEEAAIIAGLRGQLAGYKLPKRVCIVDELPRNRMGKVLKNELRTAFGQAFTGGER